MLSKTKYPSVTRHKIIFQFQVFIGSYQKQVDFFLIINNSSHRFYQKLLNNYFLIRNYWWIRHLLLIRTWNMRDIAKLCCMLCFTICTVLLIIFLEGNQGGKRDESSHLFQHVDSRSISTAACWIITAFRCDVKACPL